MAFACECGPIWSVLERDYLLHHIPGACHVLINLTNF
jgi:hypothetical protein